MGIRKLEVEISEDLYDRLQRVVQDKQGPWRVKREQAYKAMRTAVEVALEVFIDSRESKTAKKDSDSKPD